MHDLDGLESLKTGILMRYVDGWQEMIARAGDKLETGI